jgi:hypothetical protein
MFDKGALLFMGSASFLFYSSFDFFFKSDILFSMNKLKFVSGGNAKINKKVYTFSLPAGQSCPGALHCLTKVCPKTLKLTEGKENRFRCYAAVQEAMYPQVRKVRWYNFNLLKECSTIEEIVNLISSSLPVKAKVIRIHVAGDFFSLNYFKAWIIVAKNNPHILFYAYTKSMQYYVQVMNSIPNNLKITPSLGGKWDYLIFKNNLHYAKVVERPLIAKALGLPINKTDWHPQQGNIKFALVIHGQQRANTNLSRLWKKQIDIKYKNKISNYFKNYNNNNVGVYSTLIG